MCVRYRTDAGARTLQERLGLYTKHDTETLNSALHGFPLSELYQACQDRVDILRGSPSTPMSGAIGCIQTDKVTFLILAYACCMNQAAWLVKHEVLRLMTRVEDLTVPEKVAVLRLLRIETRVDALHASVHLVEFEHASRLVAARSVVVRQGFAYVPAGQLACVIRDAYSSRVLDFLQSCKKRLKEIGWINTACYAPQYATILHVMHDLLMYVCPVVVPEFAGIECSAQTLPVVTAQFAPLCIVKLVQKLRVKRHLIDKERVTLRLWLRAVHVKLEVAVEFWNKHVPEKEDVRGPIAQAYSKQYKCIGCAKIAAQGLCPFQDTDNAVLAWCADTVPSLLPDMEDIVKKTPAPFNRCSCVFALRYGGTLGGPRNPATYFARASEAGLR